MLYNASLVIEGGGMRGIFAAGVLDYFLEKEINFKQVIGVSAGACHACSYIAKQKGRAKAVSIDYLNDRRYCSFYSLLTTGELFSKKFVYDKIPNVLNPFDHKSFMENESKLYIAVTNIETGEPEYIETTDMKAQMDVLRASCALPFVSKIVHYKGNKYLDGGIAESIPILHSIESGFKKNVVILTQPKDYVKPPTGKNGFLKLKYSKYPKLISLLQDRHKLYNNTLNNIAALEEKGEIFVIRPAEKLTIDRIEKRKDKLEEVYYIGYNAAKEMAKSLKNYLQR